MSRPSSTTAGRRTTGRLRLVVIQALVFSLFATLFVRLYYLQVVGGADYQAQAASQSVREIVEQPARGLVVDAMGRPLVANRSSWVVSLDRTMLAKMSKETRAKLIARVSRSVAVPAKRIQARLVTCGQVDGTWGSAALGGSTGGGASRACWNGSPFQPVPVAIDVPQRVALKILEQPEDYPAVIARQESLRDYPSPYGINLAHVLGYLSPITEDELDAAERHDDESVNGASVVGRAGVEKQYDKWLRGMPGYQKVAVDSMGRVLGEDSTASARPGDTLVTSIDAHVQSVVEEQLDLMMRTARTVTDPVTRRPYVADSGAAVVMEARTGRIVAMASQPTYDPETWVGGISETELARLYSEAAGTPLLSRAMQGQFAPGSTWKPFMTAGALTNGYTTDTALPCTSGFQVGNRVFKNFESGAYGTIGFAKALEVSCNTFFYRIGYEYWRRYGSDVADVKARDPLVEEAKRFGFGRQTGIDIPGEASGRIADRAWKRDYFEQMKDYYCGIADKPQDAETSDFVYLYAREFCVEGYAYRAGDAVNFAIGQGDTIVTPLQLARGYAALSNGGTLFAPRVGKAIVSADGEVVKRIRPKRTGSVDLPPAVLSFIDEALKGVARQGTMAWKLGGFPLDQVQLRAKTGSAEVHGKQTTGWVASYTDDYVVVMMISQGGTGSGSTGDGIRAIWEALYGVSGETVDASRALIPGVVAPERLPTFRRDGSILPPARRGEGSRGEGGAR